MGNYGLCSLQVLNHGLAKFQCLKYRELGAVNRLIPSAKTVRNRETVTISIEIRPLRKSNVSCALDPRLVKR